MIFADTRSNGDVVEANSLEQVVNELEKKFQLKLEKQDLNTKHEIKNCEHYNTCNTVNIN